MIGGERTGIQMDELINGIVSAQEELLKDRIVANTVILNGKRYGKLIQAGFHPTICGMSCDFAPLPDDFAFAVQYRMEPKQPESNADRIRAMSDEELAVLLEGCICPSDPCKKVVNRERQPDKKRCQSCWLDWLQSPVGGDAE